MSASDNEYIPPLVNYGCCGSVSNNITEALDFYCHRKKLLPHPMND